MSEQSRKGTLVSISLHGVDLWRSDADWTDEEKARRAREAVARGEEGWKPQRPAGANLSLAEQLLDLPPAERERRAWAESVALFRGEESLLRWTFRDDSILVHLGGSWTTGHVGDERQ
jgi:hypothetical protein